MALVVVVVPVAHSVSVLERDEGHCVVGPPDRERESLENTSGGCKLKRRALGVQLVEATEREREGQKKRSQ